MVGINPFTKTRIRQRAKNAGGKEKKAKVRFLALQIELQPDGQLERLRQFKSAYHSHKCVCVLCVYVSVMSF